MQASTAPPLKPNLHFPIKNLTTKTKGHPFHSLRCRFSGCPCGRRHFIGGGAALLPTLRAKGKAVDPVSVAEDSVERFRPARPDWYEEFCALALKNWMRSYEAEIAGLKDKLFTQLKGENMNVLELGIGTGPNLQYYAGLSGVNVFAVDPNKKMEKYAKVGEALPVREDSMDAVIGTLVLCSVKDIDLALKEVKRVLKPGGQYIFIEHVAAQGGTFLRLVQRVVDPLQQVVADGCHLTRETGNDISKAGFSVVKANMAHLSSVSLISPHVYGKEPESNVLLASIGNMQYAVTVDVLHSLLSVG
ncbi:hypothetical protein QJS04_geneDACA000575 [Acorus gramineus]|uniref:Methyltransferase type 11 domain-containing protein n=1 Tax=Acorus gramineus TaxID=55184 RepID=A0AAV9AP00_ACOGR|nr:hypothetical protein QJS04_geneDACA000575 [Acorus gramineus]